MKPALRFQLTLILVATFCGCDRAMDSVESVGKTMKDSVTGSTETSESSSTATTSGDALDTAAESIAGIQEAMTGLVGGSEDAGSVEGMLPRYQWKANRKGREQARMLASSLATEDDMKRSAINLVQQIGGRRWIVAFYSRTQSVEEWPGRTAVDRKLEDYLGSVALDAGRPPKIRFHPPSSATIEADTEFADEDSMSDKDTEHAEMLLRAAKRLMDSGKTKSATLQLQAIVRRYPSSEFASEALSLLATMKK